MTSDHHRPLTRSSATLPVIDVDVPARSTWRDRLRAGWNAIVGGIGLVLGLVPHLLHHATLLAGTALVAGSGGYGALRRAGTSRVDSVARSPAPAVRDLAGAGIRLLIFASMSSLSTFVVGPAISGAGGGAGSGTVPSVDHTVHHDGDPTQTAT